MIPTTRQLLWNTKLSPWFRFRWLRETICLFLLALLLPLTVVPAQTSDTVTLQADLITVEAPRKYKKYGDAVLSHATAALRALNSQTGEALYIPIMFEVIPTKEQFLERAGGEGEFALAVSLGCQSRVLISVPAMTESAADKTRQVLVHELAHVYLDAKSAAPVPRWLHEGIAQKVAGEWQDAPGEVSMALAAHTGGLIPINKLARAFPTDQSSRNMAYAQSYSLVRYLVRNDYSDSLPLFLKAIRGEEGKQKLEELNSSIYLKSLELRWKEELKSPRFLFALVLSSGFLWGIAAILMVVAYLYKRRRSKKFRAQWAREEMMAAEYGAMNVPHAVVDETWDPDNEIPLTDYTVSDESYLPEDTEEDPDERPQWR